MAEINDYDNFKIPKGYRLRPNPKSERIVILVTENDKNDIKLLASKEGISLNAFMNKLISECISKKSNELLEEE